MDVFVRMSYLQPADETHMSNMVNQTCCLTVFVKGKLMSYTNMKRHKVREDL